MTDIPTGNSTANDGSIARAPVAGRQYSQEDAIEELGMTPDQAAQFVASGVDPRLSLGAASVTTTYPDGSSTTAPFSGGVPDLGLGQTALVSTTAYPSGNLLSTLYSDGSVTDGSLLDTSIDGSGGITDTTSIGGSPLDSTVVDSTGLSSSVGSDAPIVVTGHRIQDRPDHRVRLSAFRNKEQQVYGTNDKSANILQPLWDTQGLMFPYTPTVAVSQDTTWNAADLEGVNYDILSFKTSASASLSVTGKFTVQNQREGRYLLAAIHFLRTVSKAYFGSQDVEKFVAPTAQTTDATAQADPSKAVTDVAAGGRAGLPPPVLLFSGYGNMMFNDVRVVVKSHSWSYDEASDLIRINLPAFGGVVWLPPIMTIQMTLGIQQNTDNVRNNFSLDDFRTGKLLTTRGWF